MFVIEQAVDVDGHARDGEREGGSGVGGYIHVCGDDAHPADGQGQLQRVWNVEVPLSNNPPGSPYFPLDTNGEWLSGDRSGYVYTDFNGVGAYNTSALGSSPNTPATPPLSTFSITGFAKGSGHIRRFAFRQPSVISNPTAVA